MSGLGLFRLHQPGLRWKSIMTIMIMMISDENDAWMMISDENVVLMMMMMIISDENVACMMNH